MNSNKENSKLNFSKIKKKILQKHIIKIVPLILGAFAIFAAFIGLYSPPEGEFFSAFYGAFGFFGGNGDSKLIPNSNWLKIAAITAPLSVVFLLMFVFSQKIYKWYFFIFNSKNHFVICGLGDMGSALAKDMLIEGKLKENGYSKLVVIEADETNSHVEDIRLKGGIVIIGDATSNDILKEAKINDAKTVVMLTGKDLLNIEITIKISKLNHHQMNYDFQQFIKAMFCWQIDNSVVQQSLYVHLDNRENYELLRSDTFKYMNIKSFNLYDSAAQTLFMQHTLGINVETMQPNGNVKIALVGFDKVGESILYRILNLGHFYNQVPIEVDIYDCDIQTKEQEFLKSYPINQDICKNYWRVEFKDESQFYTQNIDYTQIVFCSLDSTRSFQDAMRVMKTHTKEIIEKNIQAYLFADVHYALGDLLSTDKNVFKNLYTFGNFDRLCTYDVIVNESLDEMAKKSNARYNELHKYEGYQKFNIKKWSTNEVKLTIANSMYHYKNRILPMQEQWKALDNFLKDSNRMQVEHLSIKFKVINHYLSQKNKQGEYEQLKQQALKKWFIYGGEMLWDKMPNTKELLEYIPLDVLDRLAQVEHNRWNAFHILNGWKKLDIPSDATEKMKKNVQLKLHPCLVKWDELDNTSRNHEHDYKSDDIETVMRIGDMVKNSKKFRNIKLIQEFRNVMCSLKKDRK
ncbi:MAG: NAD-binding protein [Campylobacterales bacterium]|nr:NAD-binding protein [Campylobacterales bacterium]